MDKIVINGFEYTDNVDTRFAGCEFCDVRIKDYDYFREHCLSLYKNDNRPCGNALYLKRVKDKSKVLIDRKVLFELCDAILSHDGYADRNDCPENDSECFWGYWDKGFLRKLENIRKNS